MLSAVATAVSDGEVPLVCMPFVSTTRRCQLLATARPGHGMTFNPFIPVYLMRNSAKGVPSRWHEDALSRSAYAHRGGYGPAHSRGAEQSVLRIKQVKMSALIVALYVTVV